MEAINLIGKLAVRTKPVIIGRDDLTLEEIKDYSYISEPIKILKVTESHIIYSFKDTKDENLFGENPHLLDERWNDKNWVDYKELIKELEISNNDIRE